MVRGPRLEGPRSTLHQVTQEVDEKLGKRPEGVSWNQ